jgi:arylsulfatase
MQRLLVALSLLLSTSIIHAQDNRPNILMLIADDLGYADLTAHGSIIRTPNIDALANNGLRFTQFHASPFCAVTRAMLLTGNNNHVAGLAIQGSKAGPVIPGLAGYENELATDRIALLPQMLTDAGYRTYMAGKWHLGHTLENSPHAAGFQRSFALKDGADGHFLGLGIIPGGDEGRYFEDDSYTDWPKGEYTTEYYTDKLISYLEEDKDSDKPFFMNAAYTSPHWPLQVPDEDLDLYKGEFEMGYDELRKINFENLKKAGIIPADSELPPRNPHVKPFAELSEQEQYIEVRMMQLYAAMIENLDRHIGRLVKYLKDTDQYDNTLIIFMSDNGAAAEDFYNGFPPVPFIVKHVNENYNQDVENMGKPGSFFSYGHQWAEAGSAPFLRHKGFISQGGIVAPMIMTGPGVGRQGEQTDQYFTVLDFMPTFLELTGAKYPEDKFPMYGESAIDFLAGDADSVHDDDYVTIFSYEQRSSLRQGDWKLMTIEQPFDERNFKLYNLKNDPGETTDLSNRYAEKRAEMLNLWRAERKRVGIILPEDL